MYILKPFHYCTDSEPFPLQLLLQVPNGLTFSLDSSRFLFDPIDIAIRVRASLAVTIEEFIQKLTESGVMLGDEITAFHESHTADTAEDFADTLIQNKKLTKYQAQQILQGKANGLLLGDYLILDTIGAGGMGQVYLAEHRRMGRQVALKTLPESVAKDLQKIKRFQREVRAAAKLSHPNVVTAYDAGEDKGVHYFVMECVDGIDLSQLVKQQGTLPVAQAVNFVLQAAKGLKYAHSKGIVHRDI